MTSKIMIRGAPAPLTVSALVSLIMLVSASASWAQARGETAIPRVARPAKLEPNINAMIWRFIGPIAGTRGSLVLGHPTDTTVFYHGASGGLWKTPDAGLTWVPLGDGQFGTSSAGAMEISLSDPDVMYVGMGEPQMRNNVSWGDGIYRSADGGDTWTEITRNPGLPEGQHGRIGLTMSQADPDRVYALVDSGTRPSWSRSSTPRPSTRPGTWSSRRRTRA